MSAGTFRPALSFRMRHDPGSTRIAPPHGGNAPKRAGWVLLVPERVLAPDDIAVEILHLCDGQRTIAQMADTLAEKYAAPADQIASDVIDMIQDLANSGFLIDGGGKP
jgi:coenzyme PQQ biosynthesis protein PqqD